MLQKECLIVHYESPNKLIYRFDGRIETKSGETFPLSYSNVILRGCCLKNTEYAIGMAAYTGLVPPPLPHSSPSRVCPPLQSPVEDNLQPIQGRSEEEHFGAADRQAHRVDLLATALGLRCVLVDLQYLLRHPWEIPPLPGNRFDRCLRRLQHRQLHRSTRQLGSHLHVSSSAAADITSSLTVTPPSNFVPISLIVTLESVKFIQGQLMSKDEKMGSTSVQASNLND